MSVHRLRAAIGIAAAVSIGSACSRGDAPPPGAQGFPPAAVKLAVATARPIPETTEYVATVKPIASTTVQPQIEGQITEIFVKSGDQVVPGMPLMQIDPRRQQAAVSSQAAERASRRANVTFAQQQYQRASELYAAGAISKQELEQAETALKTAEAGLDSLAAQVQQQEVQLRYYTVRAPTGGVLGDVPVRIGNLVTPQTLLTTIDQNATLEVYVQVPIERAGELKRGLPVQIFSSDGTDRLASTTVEFISPRVDEQTQSVLVKGTVHNPDGSMRAAQFVRARIVWKTAQGLVVPVTAVLRINGQFFAFVADETKGADGKTQLVARQRAIKVGPIVGDDYAVLDGVKPGERVVVSGVQKLADGAPIAPTP